MNKMLFVCVMFLTGCESEHEKCLKYANGDSAAISSCNNVQIDKQKTQLQRCIDSTNGNKEGIEICQKAESERQTQETVRAGIGAVGSAVTTGLLYNSLNKQNQQPNYQTPQVVQQKPTIIKNYYNTPTPVQLPPKSSMDTSKLGFNTPNPVTPKKSSSFDTSKFGMKK